MPCWLAVAFTILRGAALALVFLLIRDGYERIRGREGIGLGDIKLGGVAGAWLEWLTHAHCGGNCGLRCAFSLPGSAIRLWAAR